MGIGANTARFGTQAQSGPWGSAPRQSGPWG